MIYICIPALNEAPTVGVLLWRIRQVMADFPRDYQLLVLDDGSTDATHEVLAPYAGVLPLTLLRNERTLGYAAALERLVREAAHRSTHPKRDVVVVLQGDFTEPPEEIPALVRKVEGGADVVGAAVVGTEGEESRAMRWTRRGLPWLLGRARLPKEAADPLSGFRAYRVQVLRRALQEREGKPLLTRSGWAANVELLMRVLPHTRRADAAEVSLRYTRRERETRFRPWGTVREVWDLVRTAPRAALAPPAAGAPGGPPAKPQSAAPGAAAQAVQQQKPHPAAAAPEGGDAGPGGGERADRRRGRPRGGRRKSRSSGGGSHNAGPS